MKFEENWSRGFSSCGHDEKSFKGVDGRTTTNDRRQVITKAHPEPCSGELKKKVIKSVAYMYAHMGPVKRKSVSEHA